ncbi:MAG TPA: DUF4129 domain-containing protein [Candidatus Hydrogenedentes bacterium]|nr:DUF4129 domain-containing protein [Candidatus Hydrogenedentota bacterium]HOL77997.1 DUF4129 domain-containing protein [Candidatus Hydrogenedentota bacterium]HPO87083.1 DUF4129 domain-containing protein [Candidatus Hydrogenedentota bacterium]
MKYPPNISDGDGFSDEDLPVFESLEEASHLPNAEDHSDISATFETPTSRQESRRKEPIVTDFATLSKEIWEEPRRFQRSTFVDALIAFLTPFLIFVLVISVVFYLLDIRYIYTEVMDQNISFAAFFFVLGVVALNRLVARDGTNESLLYVFGLAIAAALYTFALQAYGVGSLAGSFLAGPGEPLFNACLVGFLWWVTNRLTHECCVDTYTVAGETGLLRGTAQNILARIKRQGPSVESGKPVDLFSPVDSYEPVDPSEWHKTASRHPVNVESPPEQRLKGRHPGISVFLFSIPALAVFALGERVLQHGGAAMLAVSRVYVLCYTASSLLLLMLTSLFQVRAYFRERRVQIPQGLALFWVVLGFLLVIVVLFGASVLPKPNLPPIAYVAEHTYDPWVRGSQFRLTHVVTTPARLIEQSKVVEIIGWVVIGFLGLFIFYGLLRALGAFAVAIGRQRDRYPQFVIRFFNALDRLLMKLAGIPKLKRRRKIIRISRALSESAKFSSSLADPERARAMSLADHIAYAYAALCALGQDMGVPRRPDQTPYEFIEQFPRELSFLTEEAVELTHLFVLSNYAGASLGEEVYDRLRKFWLNFERFRRHVVR